MVEHSADNREVTGSSPVRSTKGLGFKKYLNNGEIVWSVIFKIIKDNAWVAQLVEHQTENLGVAGSTPAPCTKIETVGCLFKAQKYNRGLAKW